MERVMDLRGFAEGTPLGRFMRGAMALIPHWLPVPILQGCLRGKLWIRGAGARRQYLGLYEYEVQRRIEEDVGPGEVFYDIGAHSGYFTLVGSSLCRRDGRVIAIEPVPLNVDRLRRHVKINRLRNVDIIDQAASDTVGTARFSLAANEWIGRLADDGEIEVPTITVDALVERGYPPPDAMKIDVEGAEVRVLRGAERTLRSHRPNLYFETHGPELTDRCLEYLKGLGYAVEPMVVEGSGSSYFVATYPEA